MLLLGEGRVGLKDESGASSLPLLFIGGDRWVEEHFPESLTGFIDAHLIDIASCLESVIYCSIARRPDIVASFGTSLAALAAFNEKERTSDNDFSEYAHDIAKNLRALHARVSQ